MASSLAIGDFARATQMSIKTLRHYHRVGLLEPAEVDPDTGYRRYSTDQIPAAQVIRRFRDLDMPVDEVRAVLTAPNLGARNELIAAHLRRLEEGLAQTQTAVASLRDLLEHPSRVTPIEQRSVGEVPAAAITQVVDLADALTWFAGALGELSATLAAQHLRPAGPTGGIYSTELFADERGEALVFIPCAGAVRPLGRVAPHVIPAVELAIIEHPGSHRDIDRSYGSLATYVTQHALAVEGSIREYYLVGPLDSPDEATWRTEIGWPIFHTAAPGGSDGKQPLATGEGSLATGDGSLGTGEGSQPATASRTEGDQRGDYRR